MEPRPARPGLPYLQVAIAATAWGTWSLFFRPIPVDARWTSAIVLGVISVFCAPLLLRKSARGPDTPPPRRPREWWWMIVLGVFDAGNALCFFAAMGVTSIAVAVLSHYLAPLFVAVLAPIVLKTPRDKRAAVFALVALFGLALVLEPWRMNDHDRIGRPLLGAMLGGASAIFYAANVLVTKKMGTRFTAEEQLVWHSVVSALVLLAVAVALRAPLPSLLGARNVVLSAIAVGATAGLLFLYGLRRMPAEHAGMLCFLEPLTAVIVAWIAWGERPGPAAIVGGLVVVASGALTIRPVPRVAKNQARGDDFPSSTRS